MDTSRISFDPHAQQFVTDADTYRPGSKMAPSRTIPDRSRSLGDIHVMRRHTEPFLMNRIKFTRVFQNNTRRSPTRRSIATVEEVPYIRRDDFITVAPVVTEPNPAISLYQFQHSNNKAATWVRRDSFITKAAIATEKPRQDSSTDSDSWPSTSGSDYGEITYVEPQSLACEGSVTTDDESFKPSDPPSDTFDSDCETATEAESVDEPVNTMPTMRIIKQQPQTSESGWMFPI